MPSITLPVYVVIPARYGSTRFPGKPLAPILGKPMIVRVLEQVQKARSIAGALVATDDERIATVVTAAGGKAILTGPARSGTERLCQVALRDEALTYLLNVQGDEPLFPPALIEDLAQLLVEEKGVVTAATPLTDGEEDNPNVVKVVLDHHHYALYFSRYPIPWSAPQHRVQRLKHLGVYGYPRDLLLTYPYLKPSPLEEAEGLEQLRWIANGVPVRVHTGEYMSIAVDTPADLARVEEYLQSAKL